MTDALKKLLEAVKTVTPTSEQREQQRRSFVYGNTHFENELITREMVDREAENLAKELSTRFHLLARHFWPGPLTIIAPASSRVPLKVTGNSGRIAVRQSKSKVANALLERLGQPLISTSANKSGTPTCTSGIEVFGMMDGCVDLILDGGLAVGPGATTVDVTEPYWKVIKEGAIQEKEIAEVLKGT